MTVLFLLFAGCAGRGVSIQVDLHGWTSYLESAVATSDEELAAESDWAQQQVETILWRQERCRLRGWSCRTEVRIFRNRHFGDGHLTRDQITTALSEAGVINITVVERLGSTPVSGGETCHVVARVLPD